MSLIRIQKSPENSPNRASCPWRMMGNFACRTWNCFLGLRLTGRSSCADDVNETRMSSVSKPPYLLLRSLHACDFAAMTQLRHAARPWITQPVCLSPDNPPPLCCLGNASSLLALISPRSYQTVNGECSCVRPRGVVEKSPNPEDVCNVTPLCVFPRGECEWLRALHGCLCAELPIIHGMSHWLRIRAVMLVWNLVNLIKLKLSLFLFQLLLVLRTGNRLKTCFCRKCLSDFFTLIVF